MSKLLGYRTLIFAWLVVVHGVGQLLGIFHPNVSASAFESGQNPLQGMFANFEILGGLLVIFLRLGQKNSERILMDRIDRMERRINSAK